MKKTIIDSVLTMMNNDKKMNFEEILSSFKPDDKMTEKKLKTTISNSINKKLIELNENQYSITDLAKERLKKVEEEENKVKKPVKKVIKEEKKIKKPVKKTVVKEIKKPKNLKLSDYEKGILSTIHELKSEKGSSDIAIIKNMKEKNKVLVNDIRFRNQILKSLNKLVENKFLKVTKRSYKLTKKTNDYIELGFITFKIYEFGKVKKSKQTTEPEQTETKVEEVKVDETKAE